MTLKSVVLPAPFGPMIDDELALVHDEADPSQRGQAAEADRQMIDLKQRHAMLRAARPVRWRHAPGASAGCTRLHTRQLRAVVAQQPLRLEAQHEHQDRAEREQPVVRDEAEHLRQRARA